ncbi:hypothetical protein LCGC14_1026720 [marine sediment metagenome]|uniref:Uncharacterized protein n=1 Tax=marine sediment metagenome TaxID=412755 RepID=A0A0F9NHK3_9ZZZZ
MIKEMKIENIEISEGEKNIVAQNAGGKILKVLFNPTEANSGVRLRIFTKEGEMIMDVIQEGLYYPRANVSSEKMLVNTFSPAGDNKDYYYFNRGLLFNITTTNPNFEGVVIDRIILIYQATTTQQEQGTFLPRILQELVKHNQREDGR